MKHETVLDEDALAAMARAHAEHVAGWSTAYDGRGGVKWQDNGGLRCSCGWTAERDEATKIRPWGDWHLHVVTAINAIRAKD